MRSTLEHDIARRLDRKIEKLPSIAPIELYFGSHATAADITDQLKTLIHDADIVVLESAGHSQRDAKYISTVLSKGKADIRFEDGHGIEFAEYSIPFMQLLNNAKKAFVVLDIPDTVEKQKSQESGESMEENEKTHERLISYIIENTTPFVEAFHLFAASFPLVGGAVAKREDYILETAGRKIASAFKSNRSLLVKKEPVKIVGNYGAIHTSVAHRINKIHPVKMQLQLPVIAYSHYDECLRSYIKGKTPRHEQLYKAFVYFLLAGNINCLLPSDEFTVPINAFTRDFTEALAKEGAEQMYQYFFMDTDVKKTFNFLLRKAKPFLKKHSLPVPSIEQVLEKVRVG
jgi:hypothetical protein